jgi:glutamate synthase (NADPH/NADH) small chain
MKSLFAPLRSLSYLGRKPVTLPIEPRPAAPNYRGFHVNDWDVCIGCGTCASICDNKAIKMVHITELKQDPIAGIKPHRPAIDYGRCCWCALCVDMCPTGSISLSREYVHLDTQLDSFFILPDEKGIHGLHFPKGWAKSDDADLLDLERQPMPELEPTERNDSFIEITKGFDDETALFEASRCVQCGMCHDACPTNMHAPEYIRAIWEGNLEEAVRQIYRTNPLASVCGRVCTHRCETACSVGKRGEAISIRWLKRYAMDSLPHDEIKQIALEGHATESTGKQIAIIGSGPAGLTVAYDLARQGHSPVIFEAYPQAGGMMRYGIPEYRLPYDKLDDDINVIKAMGVEIRCNTPIGENETMTMAQLEQDYDAVVLTTGLHAGRSTRVEGTDHPDVRSAIELLSQITLGQTIDVPEKIVVIGGGNVAFDIARSLSRYQRQKYGKIDVTLSALEPSDKMLADPVEVKEAAEEEITLFNSRGPKRCVIEDGKLKGLETVKCVSIFDEQGRFHPKYDENDLILHEAQMIVEAIGQAPNLAFLGENITERLQWDRRGRPQIDENGRTSESWLWAAGDTVQGPDVIHAVAAGHKVAQSIHEYLRETA